MKKVLITVLLVVSAAFAPCLRSTVGFPERVTEITAAVVGPLFWQVYGELLSRGLSRLTTTTAVPALERPSGSDALACFVFHFFLSRAFDGSLTAAQKIQEPPVSISQPLIRRTIEPGFTLVDQHLVQVATKLRHT
jgi:hypothetical protein